MLFVMFTACHRENPRPFPVGRLLLCAAIWGLGYAVGQASLSPAEEPAGHSYRLAFTAKQPTEVRSGPGRGYYLTCRLQHGTPVQVYQIRPDGWCAIRPPEGSFSWVRANYVRLGEDGLGEITFEGVEAWVGSQLGPDRDYCQVRLRRGELVEVLGTEDEGGLTGPSESRRSVWVKIAPPAGEFRWIHQHDLQWAEVQKTLVQDADGRPIHPDPDRLQSDAVTAAAVSPLVADAAGKKEGSSASRFQPGEAAPPKVAAALGTSGQLPSPVSRSEATALAVEAEGATSIRGTALQADDKTSRQTAQQPPEQKEPFLSRGGWRTVRRRSDGSAASSSPAGTGVSGMRDQMARPLSNFPEAADLASRSSAWTRTGGQAPSPVDAWADPLSQNTWLLDPKKPFQSQLDDLNLRLAQTLLKDPPAWELEPLEIAADQLLKTAQTAVQRGHVRILLRRIEQARDIKGRYENLYSVYVDAAEGISTPSSSSSGPESFAPIESGVSSSASAGGRPLGWAPPAAPPQSPADDRYDAVGRLVRVLPAKWGAPRYAVVDEAGNILSFITPAPGVNLEYYLGTRIGVTGTRGYVLEKRAPHVTARHVARLDGPIRR